MLSAALFGAVHMNPWQFLPATLLGTAFGWFYLRTGSVPLTMIGHGCFNGLALLAARSVIDLPGLSGEQLEGSLQLQPLWADLTGGALVLAGILIFIRTTPVFRDQPPPAPPVIPFTPFQDTPVEVPPKIQA